MTAHNAAPEAPNVLTNGAWLPVNGITLVWVDGATPPEWQDVSASTCGSMAGYERHRRRRESMCDLCLAARADYDRNRNGSRRGKVA